MVKRNRSGRRMAASLLLCLGLLVTGAMGMLAMAALKEPVEKTVPPPETLAVSVMAVSPEDVPVTLVGYGKALVLNGATLASEVAGRLVHVNPRLETGETVTKGDLLFQVDEAAYLAEEKALAAAAAGLKARIREMQIRHETEKKRLAIAQQNLTLARAAFKRLKDLFQGHQVGSKSRLDQAEQALNTARDLAAGLTGTVEAFPYALARTRAELDQALAHLASAREDLLHCRVYAPFRGRVKAVFSEQGQFVTPGQAVVRLADDRVLEIHAALDSRDVREWLPFETRAQGSAWFPALNKADCRVYRTGGEAAGHQNGELHRVVRFNPETRTLVAAVRVHAAQKIGSTGRDLPIVDGMFCRVEIPGKIMKQVFRLPESAVGFDNTVFLSQDGRLRTVPVALARIQGGEAFVKKGLTPGDRVVLTQLAHPVEHIKLTEQLVMKGEEE